MPLEIIELGDPRWRELIVRSNADVGYCEEFCRFRLKESNARALMLYFEDELGTVFDVTLEKDISTLSFFAAMADQFNAKPVDLASPEYNGPLFIGNPSQPDELMRRYRLSVDNYCENHQVVTEFVRVAPMLPSSEALAQVESLQSVSEMIYLDLRGGYENARKNYSSKRRQELNRAARGGASMKIVPANQGNISRFAELYESSMDRKKTKSVYFHSREFFSELFKTLGDRALLVEAYAGDRLASSTIFLLGQKRVWAQYEGTVYELRDTDANLYKTDRMIAWSAEHGYDYFMLGGGFYSQDGPYQYKMRFSRTTAPIRQLRKVHDQLLLERLLGAKAEYERERGRVARTDYFPSYWLE